MNPSASLMLAAWSHQTRAAGDRKRDIFSRNSEGANSEGALGSFCGKFDHGFGTQLGAVLLWRRVPSGSLMLTAWSYHRNSEGTLCSFCG